MTFEEMAETGLSLFDRVWEAWYYFIAVLIGVFMILWGIFFNGRDWMLIGAGLATFLIAGWYACRVFTAKESR